MSLIRNTISIIMYDVSTFTFNPHIPTSVNSDMLVTIIAHYPRTVNKNAIVLLTLHQKYYGEKLLQYCPYSKEVLFYAIFTTSVMEKQPSFISA